MSEPIYEFIKGQGWVLEIPTAKPSKTNYWQIVDEVESSWYTKDDLNKLPLEGKYRAMHLSDDVWADITYSGHIRESHELPKIVRDMLHYAERYDWWTRLVRVA